MPRTIVGLKGTTEADFEAAGVDILAAANAAQGDATQALTDAGDAQTDATQALADAAAGKPISISVGTDATTDSTEAVANGAVVDRVFFRIDMQYSTFASATPSLYHASGSQALGDAVEIGGLAAGEEIDIPLDIVNASGQDGVFRVTIGGTPGAGAMTAMLYRTGAPAA
jgi:hypothetical protein